VVESAVVAVGSEPEPRAFHPHLTVARAPRVRDLRPDIDAFGDDPIGPPFRVDNVLLMSSDTRPDGAVYQELARFSLSS
jgi:RNA 2',3'-cyclic 3'-phosphodiesterase